MPEKGVEDYLTSDRRGCFFNRVSYVKYTDHKIRFRPVRLHGTLGPFWGDLVVTCTCRGPCAGLEVLRGLYG